MSKQKKPNFEENADVTLGKVYGIYAQRGQQYADTWGTCRFTTMKAVADELGQRIDERCFRALASAAFVDMKQERMSGGWKEDNMIDGIAYGAYLAEEVAKVKRALKRKAKA